MLQAMRSNMRVILWVTVISFVLLIFLVWGADLQTGGSHQPNVIGMVNGEPIPISTYQLVLSNNRQNAQAQGRELQPTDELRIEEQTWNSIVNEMLLRQEAERRGLKARDAEIGMVLRNQPPSIITQDPAFRNEQGQFDPTIYRAFIQDPSTPVEILIQLENYVRDSLPNQRLQELVLSGAKVTEDELRRAYLEQNEKASFTYVLINAFQATIDPEVTDAQIEEYYNAHTEDYRAGSRVDINYLTIPRVPTPADSAALMNELVEFADEAHEADSLKAAGVEDLRKSDFGTLAQTFSDLPSADNGGLSDGYLAPSELSAAFQQAVGTLNPGEISKPFLDAGHYHIVQVVDEKEEDGQRKVQIRDFGLKIQPSDSTVAGVQEILEQVKTDAAGEGLKAAAEARGFTVRTAANVQAGGLVPGLSAVPNAAEFAHDNPEGTLSRVYPTNGAWYLLEVGAKKPAGIQPLDEVRDTVRNDILKERRFAKSRETADRFVGQLKLGETLEQVAAKDSLEAEKVTDVTRLTGPPRLGPEPRLMGRVFQLDPGEIGGPVRGELGWIVFRVDARPAMDWTGFDAQEAQLRQSRRTSKQFQILNEFLEELRAKAKIEDYRT